MSLTYFDAFTSIDWDSICKKYSVGAPVACIATSFLASWFPGYDFLAAVWTCIVGLFISIWELPALYWFAPSMSEMKDTFLDDYRIKSPIVRSILYTLLGYIIVIGGGLCWWAGMYVLMCAILCLFAYINNRSDENDGIHTNDTGEDDETGSMLPSSARFGTF